MQILDNKLVLIVGSVVGIGLLTGLVLAYIAADNQRDALKSNVPAAQQGSGLQVDNTLPPNQEALQPQRNGLLLNQNGYSPQGTNSVNQPGSVLQNPGTADNYLQYQQGPVQ